MFSIENFVLAIFLSEEVIDNQSKKRKKDQNNNVRYRFGRIDVFSKDGKCHQHYQQIIYRNKNEPNMAG